MAFVVEQIPVDKYSGYTKQVSWIDKEHYRVHKVEFYDRKGALLKVLTMSNYELYLGKYWRALRLEMENKQNRKGTVLETRNLAFKTGLKDSDFNKATLKRAR